MDDRENAERTLSGIRAANADSEFWEHVTEAFYDWYKFGNGDEVAEEGAKLCLGIESLDFGYPKMQDIYAEMEVQMDMDMGVDMDMYTD